MEDRFWCEHVGGLGPPFPACETCSRFALALRAFDLFTSAERLRCLEHFAELRYASIVERFFEAVHRVVCSSGEVGR